MSLATIHPTISANVAKFTMPARLDTAAMPTLTTTDTDSTLISTLAHALSLRRQHGSMTEARFVSYLADRLPVTAIDEHGNLHVDLRDSISRTLFTAHTDTVHRGGGANTVKVDTLTEPGQTFWRADSGAALGADDGAGVALMHHMIDRGVAGYYILFRGEEAGGVGSGGLAASQPDLLKQFDRAIAFDRANYYDVITHQSGGRCASDAFAQALADQLNGACDDFMYCPDAGGVYTDTAEFTHLIPECTNLSVGYFSQHGDREHQNVTFLAKLADALCLVKWDDLPTVRTAERKTHGKHTLSTTNDWFSRYEDPAAAGAAVDTGYEYDPDDDDQGVFIARLLEDAMDGSVLGLVDAMCEVVAPLYGLDPDEAMRYVRTHKLTAAVIDGCYDEIMKGTEPDLVLSDLYDYCAS